MDRTDIAGISFAFVGTIGLIRFALDPSLEPVALFSAFLSVVFLALGGVSFFRESTSTPSSEQSIRVPAIAVGLFILGVGAYFAV
ncbi:hypothetical protein CP556_01475 [Natrinema sp. CBA1119]|uniref:hypothetical protein n=1 Tax=Natrinema sp. CBA1119 TaxID=1608465 RepID=UPI000BF65209|nr:hypothetical protein [Natrinema sp. CBA1119]PGF14925.1 hypothetical protein CP556_01475 [Natrinema sp. CBA1119]